MSKAILRPAKPGAIVRDPKTRKALPPLGLEVEIDTYWRRRLKGGDVIEVASPDPRIDLRPEPAPAKAPKSKSKSKES